MANYVKSHELETSIILQSKIFRLGRPTGSYKQIHTTIWFWYVMSENLTN